MSIAMGAITSIALSKCSIKNQLLKDIAGAVFAVVGGLNEAQGIFEAYENGDYDLVATRSIQLAMTITAGLFFNCFTGETLISTEDGLKRIDEIQVGDMVWSANVETGEVELKPVTEVFVKEDNILVHLTVNDETINTTALHPFYVIGKGWTEAVEIEVGDGVLLQDGTTVVISDKSTELLDVPVKVYNFTVDEFHTYFVGESEMLTHNNCVNSNSDYSVSEKRKKHILDGEGPTDPGHGPNRGFSKGAFPDTWTDEQTIAAIENVANSPKATWRQSTGPGIDKAQITIGGPDINAPAITNKGTPVRFEVRGQNHGLNIAVIIEPTGEGIITGYNMGR